MIRSAHESDLPRIFALEAEYTGSHETFTEFSKRYEMWPHLFLVYVRDVVIIGEISPNISDTHVQIQAIAVEHNHWGTGIGRHLITEFERIGVSYALPFQVASGLNVTGFYQRLGYHPVMYLWYTQAQTSHINAGIARQFIFEIRPQPHGFRSIYIRPDITADALAKLKTVAQDDLSIIHEKPVNEYPKEADYRI